MENFYTAENYVNRNEAASLLKDEDREIISKDMTLYLLAGLDHESAFDKAWADNINF